jgi:hypothetical protein
VALSAVVFVLFLMVEVSAAIHWARAGLVILVIGGHLKISDDSLRRAALHTARLERHIYNK